MAAPPPATPSLFSILIFVRISIMRDPILLFLYYTEHEEQETSCAAPVVKLEVGTYWAGAGVWGPP